MNRFVFFLLVLFFASCKGDDNDCCVNIDTIITIHYTTADGNELLNSSDDYLAENIKIYYKNGDEFEYIYQGNLDRPNMHEVIENEDSTYTLIVHPSNYYEGNFSTTLIELNEMTKDTLVGEFSLEGSNQICTNAWYNGLEDSDRSFEIVK